MDKENLEEFYKSYTRASPSHRLDVLMARSKQISISIKNQTAPDAFGDFLEATKHLIKWMIADDKYLQSELTMIYSTLTKWQQANATIRKDAQHCILFAIGLRYEIEILRHKAHKIGRIRQAVSDYPTHYTEFTQSYTNPSATPPTTPDEAQEAKANRPIAKALQTNATELRIIWKGITVLPKEIGELENLLSLKLFANKLTALPSEIGKLRKLTVLDVSENRLEVLPNEIGQLTDLMVLNLSQNNLKSLPVEIQKLYNLKQLDLRKNPLPIPPEILERVNDPESILNYYFQVTGTNPNIRESEVNKPDEAERIGSSFDFNEVTVGKPLNQIKLLFVGQGSVGKTSLVLRILHRAFDQNQTKTEGISINQWTINDGRQTVSSIADGSSFVKLNIWDFGGQEIMHATHQFFLTRRSLYLLVLDARLSQEENRVEYWLKIIQSFGGESPVLIVGNKIDQHPLDIDRTGLQKKYPNIVGILDTSAATGAGVEDLKAAITEQVNKLPHVRDLLPETWFTVKTKLEELGKHSNFITHDKYLGLCTESEVNDETSQRTLIGFLHDLGVVLHFQDDPRLEALGILNPQWVTNGVYKILNSHALFQNKGVLSVPMLDEILNLPEYPRGKRLFIVDMMKKFELCYDFESDKTFLVPDLLPKDQPDLNFNGVPAFEYAYPVLPSSVITRCIVRMNQKIDEDLVWRSGVVLKIGENRALVTADIEDRKITIAIDGLEHTRRDTLSAIRYQLDEIHASIKGLNPEKRVPVPGAQNAEPLTYDYLLMLERAGQETHLVQDGARLVKINVRETLSAVVSDAERQQGGHVTINVYGPQTNVGGNVQGPMLSGQFHGSPNVGPTPSSMDE